MFLFKCLQNGADNDDEASTSSSVKKFKRRNIAMYSILTNQSTEEENSGAS